MGLHVEEVESRINTRIKREATMIRKTVLASAATAALVTIGGAAPAVRPRRA
jgi:hypothetical protein